LTKEVSRDIAVLILVCLLAYAAFTQFRNMADVAVMAEVRDRIAHRVNLHYGRPVLNVRLISDIRRGSTATTAANGFLAALYVGSAVACVVYSWNRAQDIERVVGRAWYVVLTAAIVMCAIALVMFSYSEILLTALKSTACLTRCSVLPTARSRHLRLPTMSPRTCSVDSNTAGVSPRREGKVKAGDIH
jgi:hypothetical protein